MEIDQVFQVGALSTGFIGAIIAIIRMALKYQDEFANKYVAENKKLREDNDELRHRLEVVEVEVRNLNNKLISCATERRAMKAELHRNGIEWDSSFYEDYPGERRNQ